MQRRVELREPRSRDDLRDVITQTWDDLSLDTINGLVEEMPQRLIKVIVRQGRTIQKL
jgi:hypothetical protein